MTDSNKYCKEKYLEKTNLTGAFQVMDSKEVNVAEVKCGRKKGSRVIGTILDFCSNRNVLWQQTYTFSESNVHQQQMAQVIGGQAIANPY